MLLQLFEKCVIDYVITVLLRRLLGNIIKAYGFNYIKPYKIERIETERHTSMITSK